MATLRQKAVARTIVDNYKNGTIQTAGTVLEKVGYSKLVATRKPKEIIESKGVKEELRNLGFNVEGADKVVGRILYKGKKEENRLRAADMVYRRFGSYKEGEGGSKTLILVVSDETQKRYATTPEPSNNSVGQTEV